MSSPCLPSVYVYAQIPSSHKDTNHIVLGPTLRPHFQLIICKDPSSKYNHILMYLGFLEERRASTLILVIFICMKYFFHPLTFNLFVSLA